MWVSLNFKFVNNSKRSCAMITNTNFCLPTSWCRRPLIYQNLSFFGSSSKSLNIKSLRHHVAKMKGPKKRISDHCTTPFLFHHHYMSPFLHPDNPTLLHNHFRSLSVLPRLRNNWKKTLNIKMKKMFAWYNQFHTKKKNLNDLLF